MFIVDSPSAYILAISAFSCSAAIDAAFIATAAAAAMASSSALISAGDFPGEPSSATVAPASGVPPLLSATALATHTGHVVHSSSCDASVGKSTSFRGTASAAPSFVSGSVVQTETMPSFEPVATKSTKASVVKTLMHSMGIAE